MDNVISKLKEFFGNSYTTVVCTRSWSAWGVGTMTQDDFHNISEDEELLEDLAIHLDTYPPGTKGLFWDDSGDMWYGTLRLYDIYVPDYCYQAEDLGGVGFQHFAPMEPNTFEVLSNQIILNHF